MSDVEPTAVTGTAVPGIPTRPEVPAWKLILTLAFAGVAAGLLLVFVNQVTAPLIQAHKEAALREAVGEVLGAPAMVISFAVEDERLVAEDKDAEGRARPPNYEVDTAALDRVFAGYADEEGRELIGFAIAYEMVGFADTVELIFGYDPRTRKVLGMRVLSSKETPGLGDKIEKDAEYVGSFEGASAREVEGIPRLVPVKPGKGKGLPEEIDTITGATISTKKVVEIINGALKKIDPQLDLWMEEEGGR